MKGVIVLSFLFASSTALADHDQLHMKSSSVFYIDVESDATTVNGKVYGNDHAICEIPAKVAAPFGGGLAIAQVLRKNDDVMLICTGDEKKDLIGPAKLMAKGITFEFGGK